MGFIVVWGKVNSFSNRPRLGFGKPVRCLIIEFFVFAMLGILTPVLHAEEAPQPPEDARALAILKEIDDLWRGESSHTVFTMKVQTAHYARTLMLEGWSMGEELTLIRVLRPKKEKGTTTLKSHNHIYTYLPRTDRTIRLSSGMMMGSWMGSHFTNDDLVKESRREQDYHVNINFEGQRDGQSIIEFNLLPKEDAAVVWGKITLTVRAEGYIPLLEIYYDEDMNVARTFTFDQITDLAGRQRPARMKVVPADKPDEFTEISYQEMELDINIGEEFFSIARLKRK